MLSLALEPRRLDPPLGRPVLPLDHLPLGQPQQVRRVVAAVLRADGRQPRRTRAGSSAASAASGSAPAAPPAGPSSWRTPDRQEVAVRRHLGGPHHDARAGARGRRARRSSPASPRGAAGTGRSRPGCAPAPAGPARRPR